MLNAFQFGFNSRVVEWIEQTCNFGSKGYEVLRELVRFSTLVQMSGLT